MATSPDVETLERETAEARARLADTLERLTSPQTAQAVKQEFTDYVQGVKESVIGSGRTKAQGYTEDLKARVLGNPLGIALIGAGIGWRLYRHPPIATALIGTGIALLAKGSGASAQRHFRQYHDPYNPVHPATYVPGGVAGYGYPVEEQPPGTTFMDRATSAATHTGVMARDMGSRARDTASEIGSRMSEAVDTARTAATNAAGSAMTAVGDAAESARMAVMDAAETARSTVAGAAESVRTTVTDMAEHTTSTISHGADSARRGAGRLASQAQSNPLLLGALGVAVGTALVYSLRNSEAADDWANGGRRMPPRRVPNRGYRATGPRSMDMSAPPRRGRSTRDMAEAMTETAGRGWDEATDRASEMASRAGTAAGEMASSAAEGVSGVAEAAGRMLGAAGETASSAAEGAYEAASSAYRSAADLAVRAGRRAPEAAGRVQQQFVELGDRYPLLLGAVSLAVGAAVGGVLRLSESENRLMGPTSDRLKQRARELADEQLGLAREAAEQFVGDVSAQFGGGERSTSSMPPTDPSADFETVIGGGKPAVTTTGEAGASGAGGPGREGRAPIPSL